MQCKLANVTEVSIKIVLLIFAHSNRVTLIAESVESAESTESAPMQYTNCWKSAIQQLTVTE